MTCHWCTRPFLAELAGLCSLLGVDWYVSRRDRFAGVVKIIVRVEPDYETWWLPSPRMPYAPGGVVRYKFHRPGPRGYRGLGHIVAEWREVAP